MLTEEQLTTFINKGGIDKIGQAAYTLISVLVKMAKEKGYPEELDVSVSEIMYKAKFRGYTQLKAARDILKKEDVINGYKNVNRGEIGTFFLKYE